MIPTKYTCPISNFIMLNPVIAEDNHVYDRKYIETWLKNNNTSPLTREKLNINNLIYNKELCNEIFDFILNIVKNPNEKNIELVNRLIFELENRKDELYNIDITDILKYKRDIMLHKINSDKHNENEKIFNKLFNGSFVLCHKNNIIFMLELNQDKIYNINHFSTMYNTLPDNISGKLILWNMKILLPEYNKISNKDSDSDSDSEYDDIFEKRELISEYVYSNKSDVITIIENIKNNEYKYYNI